MTLIDIAVILFGLFAGYWVVAKLFFKPPPTGLDTNPATAPNAATSNAATSNAAASNAPKPWNEILQVGPWASALEIRDAYKHLISKYHPDKVDSLGQELKDLADKKSQEITAAYQEGMRARGEQP